MNAELLDRPYVFAIALLIVGWLTAGAMAVRSVSRIWLRHWTERRLRGSGAAVTYLERPHRLLIGASTGVALTLVFSGVMLGLKHGGSELLVDVGGLDGTLDARTLAARIAQSNYSRVPIYHGTLDDVRGMVHAFDVLKAGAETFPPLRPVATATPDAPCNELLFRMLRERRHLAIVRDGAGTTRRLVSLEDLLEELVGDIRDEHDEPDTTRASTTARGSA